MDETAIYEILKGDNPEWSETKLRNAAKDIAANPRIVEAGVGAGRGNIVKIIKDLGKTFVPRKAGGKIDKSKTAVRAGLVGGAGLAVQAGVFGGGSGTPAGTDATTQANTNLMLQLAQAQSEGVDIDAILNTPVGKQLIKTPGFNASAIMNSGGVPVTAGVYTGKPVSVTTYTSGGKPDKVETGFEVSLNDWKNQFPIADPRALAAWKAKLVSAGVVSASAGLNELKQQWEAWGEYSRDMNKQGKKLTPDQLLDIQRGLWGGGGGGRDYSTQYQVNLLKEENVKSMYKAAREQEAGLVVGDEQAAKFAERIKARQMATPTKTEFKRIKGKMTPVVTPGFGEAETAAAALELAKRDPMYAEFQTANVFGSAVEKALGVRP
jgi:hypothetical protein